MIEAVVLDILGTMVDEPSGLRTAVREAAPEADDDAVDQLLAGWQGHVEQEQLNIASGRRPYVSTEVIDGEAAHRVAERAGVSDPRVIERLATASQRLPAWPDSVAALDRLARHLPVIGLSNAGSRTLLRLNANARLRWHRALSAENAQSYKPEAPVYRLAIDAAGCPPRRILMVAAHAWDLRGAQAVGMRTAYVKRPVGDAPRASDDFDWRVDSLDELIEALIEALTNG